MPSTENKHADAKSTHGRGIAVTPSESSAVLSGVGLTRKQAVSLLGMNDAEFALRLVWDAKFPKPVGGTFREADIVAWMKAQPAGAVAKSTVRNA
jgi:hypothetical protein